jgi:YD repeat-containing protein
MRIRWQGDRIQDVTDPKNRRLAFTFSNKRVAEVTGPNGIKAEYEYKGETLVSVRNMWRNTYKFEYDDSRNLTKILYPDGSFKALTYNTKQDWVTSYTDRFATGRTCTESYEYNVDPKRPKDRFWSTAVKKCGNEIENQARFEFIMDKTADGRRYMQRVKTESMTDKLEITYHPEFGRPTFINRNGQRTSFTYYDSGLIRQKDTDASKMTFQYHASNNKVSRVVTEFLDTQGKTARRRETSFQYDRKNNLVSARNSDGQSVSLTYDEKGRIASIIDQAKKEVLIRYDERTGKPATITRPKIGTITITYKPNGEILKVDSADGPTVAVQIASTFNNLLDIISPATSELEI